MMVRTYRESTVSQRILIALYLLFASTSLVVAQGFTSKGVVEDESGKRLSFAFVKVGESVDTTDAKGRFAIQTKSGDVLVVTKAGYVTRCVKASNPLNIVLKAEAYNANVEMLYRSALSKDVTSSISSIQNKSLTNNSVLAFGNALFGKLPGLNLKATDGEPGDDYPSVLIRGKHSFTGTNTPIILVDGFERDFNTLSVEEVENVSVLKDAAATALYGMDGANGVLLVTTKRGIAGTASVGFKMETGVKSPTRLTKFYGSYDYARFYNMAQRNDGKSTVLYNDTQLEGYKQNKDQMLYPSVDWFAETIRDYAPSSKYILDFRGGNQVAQYYVNIGLANDEGIFKNTEHNDPITGKFSHSTNRNLNRINFRSNVDINVTNRLSMRLDLSGRLEDLNAPTKTTSEIFNNLYTFHPNVAPVYVSPGVYGGTNTYRNNPVAYINDQGYKETHRRYFQSNIIGRYDLSDLTKGLSVGVRASFDNYYTVTDGYSKTYGVRQVLSRNTVDTTQYNLSDLFGINSNLAVTGPGSESEKTSNNLELYTEYRRAFGAHSVGAMLMYHQDTYIYSADFPNKRLTYSGSLSYGFSNKYLVDFAAQYGATENFKKGSRFGFFPAISGAWILSSESFMKEITPISYLKLRASTGLVGNQNVGGTRFGYRMLYNSNGTEQPIGNPFLTWEKSYKTDLGVDATLFNDLQMSFTYFKEYRDDILNSGDALLPSYFGNSFGYTNYGQTKSSGFEISLSKEHQYANWGYNCGINVGSVKNTIVRMREVFRQWDYLYSQGLPIGQRKGLIALGLFQNQAEIDAAPAQSYGKVIPGSIRYKDINGDNVINSDDNVAIGKDGTVPQFEIGFNLGANYRGFYFDTQWYASVGRDVYLRDALYSLAPLYGDKNVSTFVKNPWTPETAASADFPSLSIENAANNYTPTSTYWLRNGDFLRLRNVEIGYNFSQKLISKVGLSSANIYVRGSNLLTIDHLGYFDPEVLEGYPVMKSYNVGVNLKF